jgi:hypothetical protein
MIRGNPLYVDLHGYREEEIDPLLHRISDMIRSEFHNGTLPLMQATTRSAPNESRAAPLPA